MNHKQFLDKYHPDCDFSINLKRGYGEDVYIKVTALSNHVNFSESMRLDSVEMEIIKGLDAVCDRLNKSIQLHNNSSIAKRLISYITT